MFIGQWAFCEHHMFKRYPWYEHHYKLICRGASYNLWASLWWTCSHMSNPYEHQKHTSILWALSETSFDFNTSTSMSTYVTMSEHPYGHHHLIMSATYEHTYEHHNLIISSIYEHTYEHQYQRGVSLLWASYERQSIQVKVQLKVIIQKSSLLRFINTISTFHINFTNQTASQLYNKSLYKPLQTSSITNYNAIPNIIINEASASFSWTQW